MIPGINIKSSSDPFNSTCPDWWKGRSDLICDVPGKRHALLRWSCTPSTTSFRVEHLTGGRPAMDKLRHFRLHWRDGRTTDAYSVYIASLLMVIDDSGKLDELERWEEVEDESEAS